ncbi:MAG: DUF4131 domain-containing protein [Candidatus Competibacteraceae bacterium]|nr:DUF4131 domain-containing protein [Candidatus Competibacteraceae bacterium]
MGGGLDRHYPRPRETQHPVQFVVGQALAQGEESAALIGQRLRLSWWSDSTGIKNEAKVVPSLRVGDRWGFAVRLKRPHGLLNPGGFDYERWLYARGIVATGSVRSHPTPHLLAEAERYPSDRTASGWPILCADASGNPQAGTLTALAVGERAALRPSNGRYQPHRCWPSDVHSGSHIGLVAAWCSLVWGFWSEFRRLACAGQPRGRRR